MNAKLHRSATMSLSTTLMSWVQSLQTANTACDSPTMQQQHVGLYARSLCLSADVRGRWKDRDGAKRGGDFIGGGLAACTDTDNDHGPSDLSRGPCNDSVKCLFVRSIHCTASSHEHRVIASWHNYSTPLHWWAVQKLLTRSFALCTHWLTDTQVNRKHRVKCSTFVSSTVLGKLHVNSNLLQLQSYYPTLVFDRSTTYILHRLRTLQHV